MDGWMDDAGKKHKLESKQKTRWDSARAKVKFKYSQTKVFD